MSGSRTRPCERLRNVDLNGAANCNTQAPQRRGLRRRFVLPGLMSSSASLLQATFSGLSCKRRDSVSAAASAGEDVIRARDLDAWAKYILKYLQLRPAETLANGSRGAYWTVVLHWQIPPILLDPSPHVPFPLPHFRS